MSCSYGARLRVIVQALLPRSSGRRDTVWTFVSQVATAMAALLQSVVVARALGPTGKGIVSVSLLIPALFVMFLNFGATPSTTYLSARGACAPSALTRLASAYSIAVGVAWMAAVAAVVLWGGSQSLISDIPNSTVILAGFVVPLLAMGGQLRALLQGLSRLVQMNIAVLAAALIQLLTVGTAAMLTQSERLVVIAAYVGPASLVLISAWFLRDIGPSYSPTPEPGTIRAAARYGLPAHVSSLFHFLTYRLDLLIVSSVLGASAAGTYSVSLLMAESITYLPQAISLVLLPRTAARSQDLRAVRSMVRRSVTITLVVSSLIGMLLVLVGRTLISILFSFEFIDSYPALVALVPGAVMGAAGVVLLNATAGLGRPGLNAWVAGAATVSLVGLDLLLLPRWGLLGAGVASSIAYGVLFLGSAVAYLHVMRGLRQDTS